MLGFFNKSFINLSCCVSPSKLRIPRYQFDLEVFYLRIVFETFKFT